MSRELKLALSISIIAVVILLLGGFLGTHDIALFNPKGIIAHQQKDLILTELSLMLLVAIPTVLTAYFFAWRYRSSNTMKRKQVKESDGGVRELIWWVIPSILIAVLAVFNWRSAHALDVYKPIVVAGVKPLTVQVVALNWKWLFIYPEQNIATVNFLEFPANTPIDFQLTSDGPMNIFWIPKLGSEITAMSGMSTQVHLMADEPGEFPGSAAEINGEGLAGMRFVAKAVSKEDFDTWVASTKAGPTVLDWDGYSQLAKPSQNNPVNYYSKVDKDLYDRVIEKFMAPMPTMQGMDMK